MLLGIMLTAEAAAASIAAGKPVRDSTAPAVGEAVVELMRPIREATVH